MFTSLLRFFLVFWFVFNVYVQPDGYEDDELGGVGGVGDKGD